MFLDFRPKHSVIKMWHFRLIVFILHIGFLFILIKYRKLSKYVVDMEEKLPQGKGKGKD